MQAAYISSDFQHNSDRVAQLSDFMSKGFGVYAKIKAFRWLPVVRAIIAILLILVTIATIIPVTFLLWLSFKFVNRSLRLSMNLEAKEFIGDTGRYTEARRRIEDVSKNLEHLEKLDLMLVNKTPLFIAIFRPEVLEAKSTISRFIAEKEKALEVLDKPLLSGFQKFAVSEKELWSRRNPAYDYVI